MPKQVFASRKDEAVKRSLTPTFALLTILFAVAAPKFAIILDTVVSMLDGLAAEPYYNYEAPRRSKWIPRWISNDIGPIGLEMAVFCGSPTSAEIMKPIGISSRSVKKPLFRHQSHGSARVHDQPHVKTEAAAGGGRKASLYMGLVMRTQSPMRLRASGRPAALAHQGVRNLVRNPLETSKNQL